MSSTLIDMELLEKRVKQHLGELNLNHLSYVETIKLLCDALDEVKEEQEQAYIRIAELASFEPEL